MQDRVIAFGDVNVDLVTTLPRKGADGRAVAPRTEVFPGGTVGNTAAGLARLGCPVSFAGKIGNDAFGRFIRRDFEKEGVDTSFLWVEEEGFTVMIMAFIDEAGERHITVWPPGTGLTRNSVFRNCLRHSGTRRGGSTLRESPYGRIPPEPPP